MTLIEYFYPIIGFVLTFMLARSAAVLMDERFGRQARWGDFSTVPMVVCFFCIFINTAILMFNIEVDVVKYIFHGVLLTIGLQVGVGIGFVEGYNRKYHPDEE
jgi:hypothetical protein